jgi:hypothetical protein
MNENQPSRLRSEAAKVAHLPSSPGEKELGVGGKEVSIDDDAVKTEEDNDTNSLLVCRLVTGLRL